MAFNHILQLFDTDDSLAQSVATFLAIGSRLNQKQLVVATPAHWRAIALGLRATSFDPRSAVDEGRLIVLDGQELLARCTRRGQPSRALFHVNVGTLVARLVADSPDGLRVYGEMVELLAQDGDYAGAAKLEELWNELGARHSFTLLCGYAAPHFAAPDAGSALASICGQHSQTVCHSSDPLGQFLLGSNLAAPNAIRQFEA
ncbi:MAG: MEDS domain-containing protein [Vicinamibacterales bacterium]